MANLRADINLLQGVKGRVQTQIQELESNIAALNEVLYAQKDNWKGSAAKAFLESMYRYRAKAIDAMDSLKDYRDYIRKVITQLEDMDELAQKLLRLQQAAARSKASTQSTSGTTPKPKSLGGIAADLWKDIVSK